MRTTAATRCLASALEREGLGACSGRSFETLRVCLGDVPGLSCRPPTASSSMGVLASYSLPSCPIDGSVTLGGRAGRSRLDREAFRLAMRWSWLGLSTWNGLSLRGERFAGRGGTTGAAT